METISYAENPGLAAYAMTSAKSRGRKYREIFRDDRPAFERDRDRIIHSFSFRKLDQKTQVFIASEGDYYRTRLTHTLEVAQVSKALARRLRLNEDLTEALALAHDLGHTPFGHTGEHTLDELMKEQGGFEHNRQSLRVVEVIEEKYPDFDGLNLSFEVREGIIKHSSDYDNAGMIPEELERGMTPTIEAQLVNFGDEIAYNNHDIDDGLKSGNITIEQLDAIDLWADVKRSILTASPTITARRLKHQVISALIGRLIHDLTATTVKNIRENGIETIDDVRACGKQLVSFSPDIAMQNKLLKKFLYQNLYRHHKVEKVRVKAASCMRKLFAAYIEHPALLPARYQEKIELTSLEQVVCDYIAGMTDRFAFEELQKLY